ncbi:hypothetical protein [Plasmodium yoelii yoelii]|uniref:Uncharacterized protein n=1 Tax=Plasmodium yoelii yoelii TaxID=73239 RepID=Q7RE59_PLAYO|nr:hypothetical protein [Plasmodium yoelii yoelii]
MSPISKYSLYFKFVVIYYIL